MTDAAFRAGQLDMAARVQKVLDDMGARIDAEPAESEAGKAIQSGSRLALIVVAHLVAEAVNAVESAA